jgi:hypothetical protein
MTESGQAASGLEKEKYPAGTGSVLKEEGYFKTGKSPLLISWW